MLNVKRTTIVAGLLGLFLVAAASAAGDAHGITAITLRRCGGGEKCPVDELCLRDDGTARYVGNANVSLIGNYTARLPKLYWGSAFEKLAEAYVDVRRKPVSTGKPTRGVTVVELVVVRNGTKVRIRDHCPGLDSRLFLLEMSIRGIASDIAWERKDTNHDTSLAPDSRH